jgi:hypothetical protein
MVDERTEEIEGAEHAQKTSVESTAGQASSGVRCGEHGTPACPRKRGAWRLGPDNSGFEGLRIWVTVLLVTCVGAIFRFWQAGESLWLDELHTAWAISGGLAELPARAMRGNCSPAYFLLPWLACQSLGYSTFAVRLVSLLAGVATIPILFAFLRRMTGSRAAGLLSAILLALNTHALFFSLEARPYAVVQLAALTHVWLLYELVESPTRLRRAPFVVGGVLLFYLHYTATLVLVAEAVFYLAWWAVRRRSPNYRPVSAAIDAAIVAVCCLPMLPHVWEIASRRNNWAFFVTPRPLHNVLGTWLYRLDVYVYAAVVLALLIAFVQRLVVAGTRAGGAAAEIRHGDTTCFTLPSGGSDAVASGERGKDPDSTQDAPSPLVPRDPPGGKVNSKERGIGSGVLPFATGRANARAWLLCVCWLFVPVLLVWAATQFGWAPLLHRRYLVGASTAVFALAGLACGICASRASRLGFSAVVIATVVCLDFLTLAGGPCSRVAIEGPFSQRLTDGRFVRHSEEDWRAAIAYLNGLDESVRELPLLVQPILIEADALATDRSEEFREYCSFPVRTAVHPLAWQPPDIVPLPNSLGDGIDTDVAGRIEQQGGALLVVRGGEKQTQFVSLQIQKAMLETGISRFRVRGETFRNLAVVRIEVEP